MRPDLQELRQLLKEIVCEALAVAKALDPPLTLHKTADYIIDTYTGVPANTNEQ
eukprot:SAG31_NODE_2668_length_5272_cov_14.858883_3_plen_54_part_00